jgi:DNA/RNA non-specific endonuclease
MQRIRLVCLSIVMSAITVLGACGSASDQTSTESAVTTNDSVTSSSFDIETKTLLRQGDTTESLAKLDREIQDTTRADRLYLMMVRAMGGPISYYLVLQEKPHLELVELHARFGISYVDINRNSEIVNKSVVFETKALTDCVPFMPDRNTQLKAGFNTMFIDSLGRPSTSQILLQQSALTPGTRLPCQTTVGTFGIANDIGGHLIANRFGGYGGRSNLTPQNADVNSRLVVRIENSVFGCATKAKGVYTQTALYSNSGVRPSAYEVYYNLSRNVAGVGISKTDTINIPNTGPILDSSPQIPRVTTFANTMSSFCS